ncbi:hypothetical protein CVT26_011424 [Gymnopilus dilepis]|uniref:Uncharacterized protein n=1 Tax=Gymnopilus dilepis TaxID=231916 RepID=A0A409WZZ3_9AGAR|nr:hypothetical protein CVT26_011424 [Gymnopilus dilepis]
MSGEGMEDDYWRQTPFDALTCTESERYGFQGRTVRPLSTPAITTLALLAALDHLVNALGRALPATLLMCPPAPNTQPLSSDFRLFYTIRASVPALACAYPLIPYGLSLFDETMARLSNTTLLSALRLCRHLEPSWEIDASIVRSILIRVTSTSFMPFMFCSRPFAAHEGVNRGEVGLMLADAGASDFNSLRPFMFELMIMSRLACGARRLLVMHCVVYSRSTYFGASK